jgi:Family of unknown function (DUF6111)
MVRPLLTELVLFLAPFGLYALFLWVTKRGGVLDTANWPLPRVLWLLVAAFLMVIVGFILLAEVGGVPPRSTYIPAHVEDGKLVPAETK